MSPAGLAKGQLGEVLELQVLEDLALVASDYARDAFGWIPVLPQQLGGLLGQLEPPATLGLVLAHCCRCSAGGSGHLLG